MDNLNPLFQNLSQPLPKMKKRQNPNPSLDQTRKRAERSDKTKNCKFPVDSEFHIKLRTWSKQAAVPYQKKYNKPLSQTKFNTLLLRYLLKNQHLVDWNIPYKDSKRYMHTNLLKREYIDLGGPYGIAIEKGYSERKTVYIIMKAALKWLEKGGDINEIL